MAGGLRFNIGWALFRLHDERLRPPWPVGFEQSERVS